MNIKGERDVGLASKRVDRANDCVLLVHLSLEKSGKVEKHRKCCKGSYECLKNHEKKIFDVKH